MYYTKKAKELRKKIIENGYIGFCFRHGQSYNEIWEHLYLLVKDPTLPKKEYDYDVECNSPDCEFININSKEALRIIEHYIFRVEINPDLFEL